MNTSAVNISVRSFIKNDDYKRKKLQKDKEMTAARVRFYDEVIRLLASGQTQSIYAV